MTRSASLSQSLKLVILGAVAFVSAGGKDIHPPFRYDTGVFYFPMTAQTAIGIDKASIVGCEDLTSLLKDRIPDLLDFCKRAKGPTNFADTEVRLRIVLPRGEEYLVDLYGSVKHIRGDRSHSVTVCKLSPVDRKALHRFILHEFEESDDPYEKPAKNPKQ